MSHLPIPNLTPAARCGRHRSRMRYTSEYEGEISQRSVPGALLLSICGGYVEPPAHSAGDPHLGHPSCPWAAHMGAAARALGCRFAWSARTGGAGGRRRSETSSSSDRQTAAWRMDRRNLGRSSLFALLRVDDASPCSSFTIVPRTMNARIRSIQTQLCRALPRLVELCADELFPPQCTICEQRLEPRSAWGAKVLCARCEPTDFHPSMSPFASGSLCSGCSETLLPSEAPAGRCLPCEANPFLAGSARSLWWYDGVIEELICTLKYGGRYSLAVPLGRALALHLERMLGQLPPFAWNLVVPVPSTRRSLRKRGFHHTRISASVIAQALELPLDSWRVLSSEERAPQASLSASERVANVRGTFRALGDCRGARILLIDDVLTSGATVGEISRVLVAQGAEQVDLLTLARSRRFRRYRTEALFDF